jgi:aerobic-type carbon monoxide dehydrogenase small subunit (CoxS/CutS family)
VAASALLKQVPNPSLEQIKAGLAGNLCRCGTYGRVFEAVQKAAAHTPAPRRGAAAARG